MKNVTECLLIMVYLLLWSSFSAFGSQVLEQNITIDQHPVHYAEWNTEATKSDKSIILMLSGPSDTWHSDSAWWTGLGPKLAKNFRVIALDRAGQVNNLENAPVGYQHLALDLHFFIEQMQLDNLTIISFASANIALNIYLNEHSGKVKKVIMLDPDVLTPYSISRYKKDAQPFVDNQHNYLEYVSAGKYVARVEQKNAGELAHLQKLVGDDPDMDWSYLHSMFDKRLSIQNQLNMFKEIALYGNDLDAASVVEFPPSIPLAIIDTQFEKIYIEESEDAEEKAALIKWEADAKQYYQSLIDNVAQGRYIEVQSREHLFQFSEPQTIIDLVEKDF
ncbi:alpha/beta fold hydrolase [Neptunicella sp. SCSIO 80796]|uniref:alpha/beta fold hydrolase n=1 Tax=Neptunicella plasticusilytica TaxID=3117012 RepID=UPI003A4E27E8